jgi:ATP-binding cassette subfamily B protein
MLWNTNPIFALMMLSWLTIHLLIKFAFLKEINLRYENHANASSLLAGKIVDTLSNILSVHLFAKSRLERMFFLNSQKDEIRKAQSANCHVEKMKLMQGLAAIGLIFGTLYSLISLWKQQKVTLGDFTLITMLCYNMINLAYTINYSISNFLKEINKARAALILVNPIPHIPSSSNNPSIHISHGKIEFNNVCFNYSDNHPLFSNLSLKILPGQKVGLVGLSGSGKSTFVNLILRLFNLKSGNILIDDQSISNVNLDSLRLQIGLIPQDPTLFHRSVIDNIRYGKEDATYEDVISAAKKAHCHQFIQALDHG